MMDDWCVISRGKTTVDIRALVASKSVCISSSRVRSGLISLWYIFGMHLEPRQRWDHKQAGDGQQTASHRTIARFPKGTTSRQPTDAGKCLPIEILTSGKSF